MAEVENPVLFERVSKFLGKDVTHWQLFRTIEELVKVGEQQQQEYATLNESIAESDAIIEQLHQQIRELKQNSRLMNFYAMAEENLKLAQENAELKELVNAVSQH